MNLKLNFYADTFQSIQYALDLRKFQFQDSPHFTQFLLVAKASVSLLHEPCSSELFGQGLRDAGVSYQFPT